MKINHIAIYVFDLEKTKMFYETYFGGKANAQYHNSKTGLKTYFLSFDDGCGLEIMTKPNITEIDNSKEFIGFTHLAFETNSRESVVHLTNRLRSDGYTVLTEPRITGDGCYLSCVCDPDGNRIEIVNL